MFFEEVETHSKLNIYGSDKAKDPSKSLFVTYRPRSPYVEIGVIRDTDMVRVKVLRSELLHALKAREIDALNATRDI